MPYEFTHEGMLQRVSSFVEHQEFCQEKRWPPDDAIQILVAPEGMSCAAACRQKGTVQP